MIIDSISNIFNFISETNLIEEDFYNKKGIYPVYSGQTEKEGIVSYINTFSEMGSMDAGVQEPRMRVFRINTKPNNFNNLFISSSISLHFS